WHFRNQESIFAALKILAGGLLINDRSATAHQFLLIFIIGLGFFSIDKVKIRLTDDILQAVQPHAVQNDAVYQQKARLTVFDINRVGDILNDAVQQITLRQQRFLNLFTFRDIPVNAN